jgi:hypothetical protein
LKSYDGFWSYAGFSKGISRVMMDLGIIVAFQKEFIEL